MMKDTEKRRATRHRGALPVEIKGSKGVTRDFSDSGIFFETDKSFTAGQTIEFTIVLEHVDPNRPVHLKCKGEIVRVEESGQKIGVAAAISTYTFERTAEKEKSVQGNQILLSSEIPRTIQKIIGDVMQKQLTAFIEREGDGFTFPNPRWGRKRPYFFLAHPSIFFSG